MGVTTLRDLQDTQSPDWIPFHKMVSIWKKFLKDIGHLHKFTHPTTHQQISTSLNCVCSIHVILGLR